MPQNHEAFSCLQYKRYDEAAVSNADLYQTLLYAVAYGHRDGSHVPQALLLYPSATAGPPPEDIVALRDASAHIRGVVHATPPRSWPRRWTRISSMTMLLRPGGPARAGSPVARPCPLRLVSTRSPHSPPTVPAPVVCGIVVRSSWRGTAALLWAYPVE